MLIRFCPRSPQESFVFKLDCGCLLRPFRLGLVWAISTEWNKLVAASFHEMVWIFFLMYRMAFFVRIRPHSEHLTNDSSRTASTGWRLRVLLMCIPLDLQKLSWTDWFKAVWLWCHSNKMRKTLHGEGRQVVRGRSVCWVGRIGYIRLYVCR
jgi:hypothetical protein